MASTIQHLDMANIFVGDDDPTKSVYLTLKNFKLPSLEEMTKDHTGGGTAMGITIGMALIQAPTFTFQLEGLNPDIDERFMPGLQRRIKYTVRGNVSDLRDHRDIEVKAIIEGRMTKVEMSDFDREKGSTTDYEIKEVMFYALYFDNEEKWYLDYFAGASGVRRNGELMFPQKARNLGLA